MPNEEQNILKSSAEPDYGMDWPISVYERPMYAMSNLFMRGDVDAATRAIFQPDTLSPDEMKTITNRILGKNPSPLAKTVVDVATNPLVIMGLIGGFLLYPAVGKDVLAKVFMNMRKGVPETGLVGRVVGGAFTRMRHLVTHNGESMHKAIADMNQTILDYVSKDQKLRAAAHGSATSLRAQRQIALELQGYAKGADKDMVNIFGVANRAVSPGLQGKMLPGVQSMSAKTKAYLKGVWDELDQIPGFRENQEKAAEKLGISLGKYRENYLPHTVQQNKLRRSIIKHGHSTVKAEDTWRDPVAESLRRRKGLATIDPVQLREMEKVGDVVAGYADEIEAGIQANIAEFKGNLIAEMRKNGASEGGVRKAVEAVTKRMDIDKVYVDEAVNRINSASQGLGGRTLDETLDWASEMIRRPGTYSMDLDDVLTRYSTQIARAKAVYGVPAGQVESHGDKIERLVKYFRTTMKADGTGVIMPAGSSVDNYVTKQIMPMNLGQKTPKAMARNSAWMEFRRSKVEFLKSDISKKMIPEKPRKWMIDKLGDFSSMDFDSIGHGINSYLYMSAMGGNLGPVSKNVFQNALTFNNLPGMGTALVGGMKETLTRTMGYMADVPKLGGPKAFERHFKEFVEAQGPQSGLIEKLFGGQEIVGVPATGVKKGVDAFRDMLMAPFKFSELFVNRIPAFYGARAKALAWGETAKNANRIASNIVDASHFTGGPMGIPSGIIDTWAPWRQFMQFPMRTVDFMINSTRMGANPAKIDLGTISRMTAAAAGTYTVGKNLLGLDLSAGLMVGAMPFPQYENSPFYPFPLVPPIVQMGGNVIKGAATGDVRPFQDIAPLLIPGGMAVKRLKKTLGRKTADYKNRLEDGRVPVYNDRGGLIGAYTPMQLSMRAIGLMPNDVAAERGASKWLVTQRDQIRAYRQQWLEAKTANDPVKADKIQRDFKKQYPELGEMQFKKSDINSIEQRRNTARLSRIMRGMPKAYKPLFQNIMQETQLSGFTQGAPAQALPAGLEALR